MTLQDDIDRYAEDGDWLASRHLVAKIAAGLERDKIIINRADLPEAKYTGAGYKHSLGRCHEEWGSSNARRHGLEWLAIADAMESRESEAAARQRQARRDELAREVGQRGPHGVSYAGSTDLCKRAIDHIIAEQDRAAAAEAEVARLKAAS